MTMRLRTLDGGQTAVTDERFDALRTAFHGPLITPDDPAYDETRALHNGMFDRHPGLIARCSGAADVIDAVNLARERDLLVAVRGGGHGIAGHSSCDDAMMIDLSAMRGVWVNPAERLVRVQGGATWGDVDREAQVFGLAVPGGVVSTTGVAGLTLGGGLGWLHRKYGLTCDNLVAAEIVTADGGLLRATETEHEDLFWALRGGGGNFGVVTAFEFQAHPVGPIVMYGAAMYAAADAEEILPAWRDWTGGLPDEVTSRAMFWSMPASPLLPPEVHNRDVFIVGAVYAGPPEDATTILRKVGRFGTPLADLSGPRPFRDVQRLLDWMFPKGELLSYWKSVTVRDLGDDVLRMVLRRGLDRPHPTTLVHVPQMGGAVRRLGPQDTAFGDRSAAYIVSIDGNWTDPADTQADMQWVRDAFDEVNALPSACGTYLNFSSEMDVDAAGRQTAFGENLDRLGRVKQAYDPENRFRLNNNIRPAGYRS
ncbi:FAD-binding oxidoreductase [Dactylosporangium aurantiacum]|uniref:FAD-binding oxidoreductase n=1 Tax=Dactylosporangium aurantiacum TaxID=35754 RepID=A0A9Q9MR60_9ACTN|nr:FAD-binding oxidoreductase [Dactylosporangium aurantiacum]MDG6106292.1 FAD-binding oxidoreductase [Dactylosporangium aurantiacum]UWZ58212.1 FAD-binding oxidoreductase [Dactylosporangium aurantiacum]